MPEPREKSASKASARLPATTGPDPLGHGRDLPASARRSISCCRPPRCPEPLPPQHQNAETLLFGLLIPAGVATVLLPSPQA